MGRAIVRTPAVFLFDEPLSNLDAQLRAQMRIDIKQLHQRMHATAVYVTHDQVEAMTLGDRIVVMRDGHVEQVGPPEELFWKPANTFVAGFIGNPPMNLLRAEIVYSPSENTLKLGPDVRLPLAVRPDFAMPRDNKVIVGIRSQDITPANGNESPLSAWRVAGAIEVIEPHGNETYLHIDLNGQKAMARCTHRHGYHVSDRVDFDIDPENLHLFDAATSERI
jgi:multiple sugar transport system ATP-binding protein